MKEEKLFPLFAKHRRVSAMLMVFAIALFLFMLFFQKWNFWGVLVMVLTFVVGRYEVHCDDRKERERRKPHFPEKDQYSVGRGDFKNLKRPIDLDDD